MEYVIETGGAKAINWAAKGTDRVLQNVINIVQTFKYEVAHDRTMGIDSKVLHMPADKSMALVTNEIVNQISIREPRAKVKGVRYAGIDSLGNMQYKVVVEI